MARSATPICPDCGSAAIDPVSAGGPHRCRRCGTTATRDRFLGHVRRPQAPADWDRRTHVQGRVLARGITDDFGVPGEGET